MARTVRLEIDAKVTGLINGLKTAQKATQDSAREFDKWAQTHEQSLNTVGQGMTAFGLVAAGGATLAVKKFADFDKAMSSVQAATHESETNMGLLRQAAIDAGADTAFSAEEAARGIEELAKAGVSTADIMSGGLTGALDLAAAGELEVGKAAEIASSAMTQFKLGGDQVVHLADLLAAGAGKAQGGVEDLGMALNQSGLVAASTGLTIEETVGGLTAFASAGLLGSDAGTSFKTMLQRLTPQSKAAQAQFDELGISAYDAQGNFVGLADFAGQLQTKMADLTPEARNAAMSVMFGSDAVRASNVLYEQGAAGIQKWIDQVDDAGYAADTAAIMQNNLAGDLEKLGGAFDTVFIQSGGAANDALRGLVQTAESVVDAVGKIPAPILGVGTVIGGLAGGAALLGGGLITVLPKIRDTRDAMNDLFPAGSRGANGLNKVKSGMADLAKGAAVAGGILTVGVAIGKLAEMSYTGNIIEGTGHVAVKLQEIIDKAPGANSALDEIFKGRDGEGLTQSISGVDDAIDAVFGDSAGQRFNRWGENLINATTGIKGSVEIAEDAFRGMDAELANLVNGGNADGAAQAMDTIMQKLKESGVSAEEAAYLFPQYADALNRVDAESQAAAGGSDVLAGALEGVGAEAEETAASLDDILASLFELGVLTRDTRAAEADFEAAIDGVTDSIDKNGQSLDITTEKGRANQAALDGLASSGQAYTESLAQSGASEKELQASMQGTYDSLITAAGQFGITGDKATALAREIMGVPDGVSVDSWMSDSAKQIADGTADAIEAIPGYTKVSIAVSEDGTVGQVQSRINEVTGKTEYVFVTDDGTVQNVQAGIANIDGKDVPVYVGDDGTVYSTQGKINGIKGKGVTIVADAATGAAEAALNNAARDRVSVIRQRVVNGGSQTSTGRGGRGGLTYSSGGYTGPGGKYEEAGIVHRDEHVIRKESRNKLETNHPGLLDHMNRFGTVPTLGGYASGGRVGWARNQRDNAKAERDAANAELKRAKKSKNDKWKTRAQKAYDAAKSEYEDARDRVARLAESEFDLRRGLKRGDIRESFMSGSGMSVVDRLFEQSSNKDLSKGKRSSLRSTAYGMETQLLKLEKRSDSLAKSLDKAASKRDELLFARNQVRDSIVGSFDLGSMTNQRDKYGYQTFVGKKGLLSFGKSLASGAKKLSGKVSKLQKLGFNESMIQQVIDEWSSTGTFELADAMLSMSKAERGQFNSSFKSLERYGTSTGNSLTNSMHKGGLDAASGLVRGLESKSKDVDNAFYKMGKDAEKAFKRSLGIKSPSKVMFGAGVNVGEGAELGMLSKVGDVSDAAAKLMTPPALTVPPSYEVARYASGQASPSMAIDYNQLAQAMANVQLNANLTVDRRQAGTLVQAGQKFNGTHK